LGKLSLVNSKLGIEVVKKIEAIGTKYGEPKGEARIINCGQIK